MGKVFPQHSCCQYSNYRGIGSCQIYPELKEGMTSQRRRNPIGTEVNSAPEIVTFRS